MPLPHTYFLIFRAVALPSGLRRAAAAQPNQAGQTEGQSGGR